MPAFSCAENSAFLGAVQDYDVKFLKPLQFTRSDILEFAALWALESWTLEFVADNLLNDSSCVCDGSLRGLPV